LAIQTFIITSSHKNGVAFGRGGVKGGGNHCRHCHAAEPGFTLKAVDSTAMLTQVAVGEWMQVIFYIHIIVRA
jgi:hypothetical protein